MKNNISYFRHEVDSFNHWKFKTLRKKYGWAGEGQFWALNSIIAASEECTLDLTSDVKKRAIAAELDMTISEFTDFIDYLVQECTLVKMNSGFLTTGIVQEIYGELSSKRQKDRDRKLKKDGENSDRKENVSAWKDENSNRKTDPENHVEATTIENDEKIHSNRKTKFSTRKSYDSKEFHAENDGFHTEFEQSKVKESKVDKTKEEVGSSADVSTGGEPPTHPPKKIVDKQAEMVKRQKAFGNELQPFEEKYGREMLKAFFLYWSEPNRSKTKMKFELQQTFDISRRLITWEGNQPKFDRAITHNQQQQFTGPQLNILE